MLSLKLYSSGPVHFLNQSICFSAISPQKPFGSSKDRLCIFLYSSIVLRRAFSTNSFEGEKVLFSMYTDSTLPLFVSAIPSSFIENRKLGSSSLFLPSAPTCGSQSFFLTNTTAFIRLTFPSP